MTTLLRALDGGFASDNGAMLIARFLDSKRSYGHTAMRLTLAFVLLPHGMQHLFGMFGGSGFSGTLNWMTGTLGIPAPLAAAAIVLEFVAPVLLIMGAGTRVSGVALAVFMATAASTHVQNGFFMNWFGTLPAGHEGFEYHLLTIAIAASVAVNGAGAASLDRVLARRLRAA